MKKKVSEFVKQHGGVASYCGNNKIMYISQSFTEAKKVYSVYPELIEDAIIEKFGYSLPFKITSTHNHA